LLSSLTEILALPRESRSQEQASHDLRQATWTDMPGMPQDSESYGDPGEVEADKAKDKFDNLADQLLTR
jgi:hypothetical protein